jgi:plastocyanin
MPRAALIALIALAAVAAPARAATKDVSVSAFAFSPATVDIAPGDTVKWTFAGPDLNHSTTSDAGQAESWESDPGIATPVHAMGDTFSHTFSVTGQFGYLCRVHPSMRGTVRVTAPGQPAPGGGGPQPGGGQPQPGGGQPQPGGGQPQQPTADTAAPVFGTPRVSVRRRRVSFKLDEAASVQATLRGGKTRRALTLNGKAGTNVLKLPKRLRGGRYALTLIATDAAGNVSAPRKVKFTVTR